MSLTDLRIKKAPIKEKAYKIFDRDGLYLLVYPTGSKVWRYKYKYAGKEKLISFDRYPEVSLLDAREKQFEARKLLTQGIDPSSSKREDKQRAVYKAENTFEIIATQWHETNSIKWTPRHAKRVKGRMEKHLFPIIGKRPIDSLKPLDILSLLRKIEAEGKFETVHRLLNYSQNIFRFAVIIGLIESNPARELGAAIKPKQTEHFPSIKADELKTFLEELEQVNTSLQNKLAVKLQLATFLRTNELRQSKWEYIDFKTRVWIVPADLMKMKLAHIVPLSDFTICLLKELWKITGHSEYILPNTQKKKHPYMSENTINYVIDKTSFKDKLVGHGFRSLASTTLNEHGFNKDAIERQLAHKEPNKVRAAYNHAEYMLERIKMMQWWGNFINSSYKTN